MQQYAPVLENDPMQQDDRFVRLLQRLLDRGMQHGAFAMLAMCLDLGKFSGEEANVIASRVLADPIDVRTLPGTYPRPTWNAWIGSWEYAFRCFVDEHPAALKS